MRELRYVGKETPRPDAPDKVAGQAYYIHDLARPGMLYGKIKFSDQAHARIERIDTSKAERVPGVRAVLTGSNTPPVRVGFLRDNLALKKEKVRCYRDELAVVVATDPEIAEEAVRLIDVEVEPLPGLFTPAEALADGAPLIHETDARGRPLKSNRMPLEYHHRSGDIEAGRAAAKTVVEGTYSTPWIQQSCMGTAGCIAELDLNSNLTIWAKTQIPFLAQRDFNRALKEMGLEGKNSRVIVPALGGAFGTGLDTHCYEYIAILAAYHTGRPVKILYDRREEFANLSPRQSATVRIAQGCDAGGKLTFREVHVLQDNGAYASWGATYPSIMLLPATSLYRVQNVRFDADLVYTNNTYSQAMRGYGNPEITWALECNLDDLACAAGIDPFELRKLNQNVPNETTPMGLRVSTCGLGECLDVTAKKLNWKERRSTAKRRADDRKATVKRGVGMASLIHVGGSGRIYNSDASGLIVKLDDFGNVNVYCGGVEMGQGLHSALSLMVAEALGVTPDKVHINQTDTATCPWDVGTHASRGAFMAGNAAILAANALRAKIFAWCERIFAGEIERAIEKARQKDPDVEALCHCNADFAESAKADDFELRDNRITVKGGPDEPWASLELERLLRAIHFRPDG
ncbi:MAG: xanthine dehydrogenase family protein, partial [Myxococcota bacterium]